MPKFKVSKRGGDGAPDWRRMIVHACFTGLFLLAVSTDLPAQSMIAGRHTAENYFVDIDPDTTLIGCPYTVAAKVAGFYFDLDGDYTYDLYLNGLGDYINGTGDSRLILSPLEKDRWEMAAGYIDTCYYFDSSNYRTRLMAASLHLNDTIDRRLNWCKVPSAYLAYVSYLVYSFQCNVCSFYTNPGGNFLAVRRISPNDTLYGWISLANVTSLSFTVKEFAFERKPEPVDDPGSLIKTYPVPVTERLTVEALAEHFDLAVFDHLGQKVLDIRDLPRKSSIDLNRIAAGIYILRFTRDQSVVTRKIIRVFLPLPAY